MAKPAQQRRGGGGQSSAPRQMERVAEEDTADLAARAEQIILAVRRQQDAIEAVMPSNITFGRFLATLTTALRHNPDILKCTNASIVQACCKAAYDGLALDGREAALVPQNVKIATNPDRYQKHARYNPMVYGFIKQMIDSGLVADAHATLVYEGEPYKVIRGTNESIEHEELPELRGPLKKIRAVYCIARLTNGLIKFESMSAADVEAVKAMAATDYVWKKNPGEMSRKTVIRRLRKTIAGGRDIRDAEAMTMYPHFQNDAPALPAPAKPDRRDYQQPAQLEHEGPSVFTDFDARTGEVFEERQARDDKPAPAKRQAKAPDRQADGADRQQDGGEAQQKAGAVQPEEQAAEQAGAQPAAAKGAYKPKIPVPTSAPSDEAGWNYYADTVIAALPELKSTDEINAERRSHQDMIDQAPGAIGDKLADAFADALTDLV